MREKERARVWREWGGREIESLLSQFELKIVVERERNGREKEREKERERI